MTEATVAEVGRKSSVILSSKDPTVVTNNGRVQNVIINVSGLGIDEAVDLARTMQAKAALSALRKRARVSGVASLSDGEIDAEIADARAHR